MKEDKKKNSEDESGTTGSGDEKMPKFDIRVNEFGEIVKDYDIEQINRFLDENTNDKKINSD